MRRLKAGDGKINHHDPGVARYALTPGYYRAAFQPATPLLTRGLLPRAPLC